MEMLKNRIQLPNIYPIIDSSLISSDKIGETDQAIMDGGAKILQLRAKNLSSREFLEPAHVIRKTTKDSGAVFIVNDRVDITLPTDADGVHLGQDDLPVKETRRLLGNNITLSACKPRPVFVILNNMLPIRIYYEDTDCGGVVYYANYLKYFERGRVEFFRDLGISISDYHNKGIIFVVTKVEAEYILLGRYDDLLLLDTRLTDISGATITFRHSIRKEGSEREFIRGSVSLASVNKDGKPARIPEELGRVLSGALDR